MSLVPHAPPHPPHPLPHPHADATQEQSASLDVVKIVKYFAALAGVAVAGGAGYYCYSWYNWTRLGKLSGYQAPTQEEVQNEFKKGKYKKLNVRILNLDGTRLHSASGIHCQFSTLIFIPSPQISACMSSPHSLQLS